MMEALRSFRFSTAVVVVVSGVPPAQAQVHLTHLRIVDGPIADTAMTLVPGSIQRIETSGSTSTVASVFDDPSGLAFDSSGNLYYGNVTFRPVRVSLFKRSPEGTVSNLGQVVDTSAGFVNWTGIDLAVFGSYLYFTHLRIFDTVGDEQFTVVPGSIRRINLETGGPATTVIPGLDNPSGLAFDSSGNLYYGNVTLDPVRVSLFRRSPEGIVSNLGQVVDTSAGRVQLTQAGPDLAVFENHLYFTHMRIFDVVDGQPVTITPGSIRRINLETGGPAATVVSVLDPPSGTPLGLAFDSSGNLYYGSATLAPVRVSLFRRSPQGAVSNLGQVVDTSAGFVFQHGVDLAADSHACGGDNRAFLVPEHADLSDWVSPCYNCMSYAFNAKDVFFAQFPPHLAPADRVPTCGAWQTAAEGIGLRKLDWDGIGEPPDGCCHVVALYRSRLFYDFHWARRNLDGTWSEKVGMLPARLSGVPSSGLLSELCGFFCVDEASEFGLASNGDEWGFLKLFRTSTSGVLGPSWDIDPALLVERLPSGLPPEGQGAGQIDGGADYEFALFADEQAQKKLDFPPFLLVGQGSVTVYSDLDGTERRVLADDNDLSSALSAVASHHFVRGDCNGDGEVNLSDAIRDLRFCFSDAIVRCEAACDTDGDGDPCTGVTDGVRLLMYLFRDGGAPPAPFPDCGAAEGGADCARPPQSCP